MSSENNSLKINDSIVNDIEEMTINFDASADFGLSEPIGFNTLYESNNQIDSMKVSDSNIISEIDTLLESNSIAKINNISDDNLNSFSSDKINPFSSDKIYTFSGDKSDFQNNSTFEDQISLNNSFESSFYGVYQAIHSFIPIRNKILSDLSISATQKAIRRKILKLDESEEIDLIFYGKKEKNLASRKLSGENLNGNRIIDQDLSPEIIGEEKLSGELLFEQNSLDDTSVLSDSKSHKLVSDSSDSSFIEDLAGNSEIDHKNDSFDEYSKFNEYGKFLKDQIEKNQAEINRIQYGKKFEKMDSKEKEVIFEDSESSEIEELTEENLSSGKITGEDFFKSENSLNYKNIQSSTKKLLKRVDQKVIFTKKFDKKKVLERFSQKSKVFKGFK